MVCSMGPISANIADNLIKLIMAYDAHDVGEWDNRGQHLISMGRSPVSFRASVIEPLVVDVVCCDMCFS